MSWSTDQPVVPAFDSLDASFSLGTDPVSALSFTINISIDDTARTCPYASGLRVPLVVSLSSSDGTLVASGTVLADAGAAADGSTTFHDGYTVVGSTVPDDIAAAVASATANRCDGTTDTYVALEGTPVALGVAIGGYCEDSTNGPAQDQVASGTLSEL